MFSKPVCRLAIVAIISSLVLICGLVQAQSTDWPKPPNSNITTNQHSSYEMAPKGLPNTVSASFGNSYSNGIYYNQWRLFYQTPLKMNSATFVNAFVRGDYNDFGNAVQPYGTVTALAQGGASLFQKVAPDYYLTSYLGLGGTRRQGTWYGGGQGSVGILNRFGRADAARLNFTYYADSISDTIQFPDKPTGYEFTAGYTYSLGYGLPLINASIGAYRFYTGITYNGWRLTGDILGPFNMLSLRGEVGYDPFNGNFRSLSAMLTYFFSLGL